MKRGIDMTLLPEPWRSEYVPIAAVQTGESLRPRATLRVGDLLLRRRTYDEVRAKGSARSLSVWPIPPESWLVGRDVTIEQLYPDLWADWRWID